MFKEVARDTDKIWEHETKPHWIVHYPGTRVTGEHYQAYRAVERVPVGRKPWTVDNRRIGTQDGYRTLEAAMQAAA